MKLDRFFEMQAKLDDHIKKEKGLEGQDLLDKKILALQVELGELANEWRGFKFWSTNQEPRDSVFSNCDDEEAEYFFCGDCHREFSIEDAENWDYGCNECFNTLMGMKERNPLLEEYVDCLHFILSIGNDINADLEKISKFIIPKKMPSVLDQFMWTSYKLITLYKTYRDEGVEFMSYDYTHTFSAILGLGEMLGFTWEQIEQAYLQKNEVNHQRQESGY